MSSSDDSDSSSGSSSEEDNVASKTQKSEKTKFQIPKFRPHGPWTDEELDNFRRNWPHLKNFADSVLRHASLSELTGMARQKVSSSKVFAQVMTANYETLLNFPVRIEAGEDQCTGLVHSARFLRGYVGDTQELWIQARKHLGPDGLDPIGNYEVVSLGIGDLITPKTWGEIHKPNSRHLLIGMLSQKSVEESWRLSNKSESPKEFESMQEFRMAIATLDLAISKVMPWNMACATLHMFLISNNFGETELENKPSRLTHLANFVDEVLRANARNWEESKVFLSHQDLCVKWNAAMLRVTKTDGIKNKFQQKKKDANSVPTERKPPAYLCKKFNDGNVPDHGGGRRK